MPAEPDHSVAWLGLAWLGLVEQVAVFKLGRGVRPETAQGLKALRRQLEG